MMSAVLTSQSERSSASASGFVPVIDMHPALSGSRQDKLNAARAVGRACETSGFFAVVGHNASASIINDLYVATRRFFSLPDDAKSALLSDPDDPLMRGFGRAGSLAASAKAASVEQERQKPDLSETFTINRLGDPNGAANLAGALARSVGRPNKWPEIPGFVDAYRTYYRCMEVLARDIMRLFALALDLPEGWFDDKIDKHMTNLTANYYPPQLTPPKPGQLRKGQHSDWGSLTILYHDDAPGGLQVLDKGGEWHDVPAIPGSFVINLGDLMAIWTNNRWVSTVHRVVNPPAALANRERYSIAFFNQPNFDALIECIPGCSGPGRPQLHEPVLSGEYILQKFRLAYG